MRIYPIALELTRTPTEDDILPLTKPIVGASGKVYTELPIPKGTSLTVSFTGYNLYIFFVKPLPRQSAHTIFHAAGTRICGVQMLMRSGQSVGLK